MTTLDRPTKKLVRNRTHQKYFSTSRGYHVPGASTISKIDPSGETQRGLMAWVDGCRKKGIDYRKVRDQAGDIGTICHFMIECYIEEVTPNLDDFTLEQVRAASIPFNKFLRWWDQQDLVPIAPELQLVSEKYGYGGTLDLPCRDRNGGIFLPDWKSSKAIYPEYFYQLAAYENLLHEYMQEQVVRRAIIRFGKDPDEDPEIREMGSMDAYFNVFKAQLALYNAHRDLPIADTQKRLGIILPK